jgi:outer membrane murein-binding lipoprotein Lpp
MPEIDAASAAPVSFGIGDKIEHLEAEVEQLRTEVDRMRADFEAFRSQFQ